MPHGRRRREWRSDAERSRRDSRFVPANGFLGEMWRQAVTTPTSGMSDNRPARHKRSSVPHAIGFHIAILVVAAAGVLALWNDLAATWRIAMAVVVVAVGGIRLLPLTKWFGRRGTVIEYIGAGIGLLVIRVFALLGADAILAHFDTGRLSPAAGLGVGFLIVLVVARVPLEPFWTAHELSRPGRSPPVPLFCSPSCPGSSSV